MKQKGLITVFLTLILTILVSFVTALAADAQRYVCRSEAAYAMDCAIRSVFAEYDRDIYESSGMLVINSSYRSDEGGIDRIRDHFSMYLTESLTTNELVDVTVSGTGEEGLDECYTSLSFSATFTSPVTGDFTITRDYSYDTSDT